MYEARKGERSGNIQVFSHVPHQSTAQHNKTQHTNSLKKRQKQQQQSANSVTAVPMKITAEKGKMRAVPFSCCVYAPQLQYIEHFTRCLYICWQCDGVVCVWAYVHVYYFAQPIFYTCDVANSRAARWARARRRCGKRARRDVIESAREKKNTKRTKYKNTVEKSKEKQIAKNTKKNCKAKLHFIFIHAHAQFFTLWRMQNIMCSIRWCRHVLYI